MKFKIVMFFTLMMLSVNASQAQNGDKGTVTVHEYGSSQTYQGVIEERPGGAGIYLPSQQEFIPFNKPSNQNNNGTPSVAQQNAEIRQMQAPQPVPQHQPSCFAGCALPQLLPSQTAGIRMLDGFLVGWKTSNGNFKIKVHYLPELHLLPSILKYSGVDISLYLSKDGSISRNILWSELNLINKKNPEKAKEIAAKSKNDFLIMGYADQFGNIIDLQGKKIAYEEVGSLVFDTNASVKVGLDQIGNLFAYHEALGIFEPNGDVRDVHNRLVGHLDESKRHMADNGNGQPAALKLIQKYEKQHPWHPVRRKIMKK